MSDASDLLTLRSGQWYAWEMLPGYFGAFRPYYSPIFVENVVPMKSGKGVVRIKFTNAAYAGGVQDFDLALRVIKRAGTYMIGEIDDDNEQHERTAVIGEIDFEWLGRNFSGWFAEAPPDQLAEPFRSDVQRYLDGRFRRGGLR